MREWKECRKILCVRPDNMGDLLMSAPAIAALKKTFECHLTVLTSSMAAGIAACVPAIDAVIEWNVPWVKSDRQTDAAENLLLVERLRRENFDAAIIFTVFSQNPLPTALLLTLAEIPRRLAYCRENPYALLTDWVPEKEPYSFIRHQVRRDLDLVKSIGAETDDEHITLRLQDNHTTAVLEKLLRAGIDPKEPWVILHPGVSEVKRQYPENLWIETAKSLTADMHYQLVLTGIQSERVLAENIRRQVGESACNFAGALSLEEYIALIGLSPLVISVNTATVHVASAMRTKVVVLYALTNPQHGPWRTVGKILPYSVPRPLQSRNEVLRYVQEKFFPDPLASPLPDEIVHAAQEVMKEDFRSLVPELVLPVPSRNEQNPVFP